MKALIELSIDLLHWMPYRSSIYWWSDIIFQFYFVNIDFVNIYFQIAYIEYQIVFDIYEVLTKACIYQFIVALFSGKDSTWLLLLVIFIGYKAGLSVLVVICEGGKLVIVWLSFSLLKTPGHWGCLPWASPP